MTAEQSAESVASGLTAPQSHLGTCEICREPTVWCMAGYWVHQADEAWDHQAVTHTDGGEA